MKLRSFPKKKQVGFVFGKIWLFSLLTCDLAFLASGTSVRCQPPCSSRFACLGNHRSHVVLPLIKLHKQGAATVLPSCPCYFTHLGPDLYSKGSCAKCIIWDCYQLAGTEVVESESAVHSDQFSREETGWFYVRADVAFQLVDLTFHRQWLNLQKQGATVLPSCACNFDQLGPDLHSRRSCARITSLGLLPASRVSKVRNRDCAVQKS